MKQLENTPQQNQDIMREISSLCHNIRQILKLTKGMKLPPGLYIQLKETFKCHICQALSISPSVIYTHCCKNPLKCHFFQALSIIPPVIYTHCCKNLLGCESCVDKWNSGNEGIAHNVQDKIKILNLKFNCQVKTKM